MGIKEQIADAEFLSKNGRYLGALSMLLLAVAASSRRAFPKGTKSFQNPSRAMGDQEAFCLFLGGRLRRFVSQSSIDRPGDSGFTVRVGSADLDLAFVLYKHYRCALVHEGQLPIEVEFLEHRTTNWFAVRVGPTLQLDLSLIPLLGWVVEEADCNADLYGRVVYDVCLRSGQNSDRAKQAISSELDVSLGRLEIVFSIFYNFETELVEAGSDDAVNLLFREQIEKVAANLPLGTLVRKKIVDVNGNLLPKGIGIMRRIAKDFHRIPVGGMSRAREA